MNSFLAELSRRLEGLRQDGLERRLARPAGIDFSSNDYLGLASHPALARGVLERLVATGAVGAPASRLLRGHTALHERLEERLAAFKGAPAALFLPSGYQANLALLTALVQPADRVLSDCQNHASLIDALRLARAHKHILPHLDLDAARTVLAQPHPGRTFWVTESLFSMDGDIAPLGRYAALAEHHGALLVIDDAHATGLYGARGSGLVEELGVADRCLAVVSTGGKALGVAGAFITGPRLLVDFLIQTARPFIFSTAVPPVVLHAIDAALDLVAAEPWRRTRALTLAERLRSTLAAAGFPPPLGQGPIVPVIVGDNERAVAVARELQGRGLDVRAVRPPTVAPGTARLRISVHADHREEDVDRLARAVLELCGRPVPAGTAD
jgi:8-amino-7-oxononanoate synthase